MAKLFIPNLSSWAEATPIAAMCTRLGISATEVLDDSVTHVFPLGDFHAGECVDAAIAKSLPYFSHSARLAMSDRVQMAGLSAYGIPTLNTIIPMQASDISSFASDYVVIKKRRTYRWLTGNHPASYKVLSKAALIAQLDQAFWDYQASPDALTGEYVLQEAVTTNPNTVINISFSVNASSQIYGSAVKSLWDTNGVLTQSLYDNDDVTMNPLIAKIQAACTGLNIKCCTMNAQFIMKDGVANLMDWNLRMTGWNLRVSSLINTPRFDAFFEHMLGLSFSAPSLPHFMYRRYDGLSDAKKAAAASFGLTQLPNYFPGNPFFLYSSDAVMGTLQNRFSSFEASP